MSKIRLFVVCLGILVIAVIIGCSEGTTNINPSPTDVVTITDINKFIT
ncbi:MAG: hypothetical protein GYA16_05575, partial [Spirochaetes bacterium]|nr:hypothetical protein [Spirochaetota bacterium]